MFEPAETGTPQRSRHCLIIALAFALETQMVAAQTQLPTDVKDSCTITKGQFQTWLAPDGSFSTPDNINFPTNADECTFFKQAEQMFLWVTSRLSPGSRVFGSSPPFYAVSASLGGMRRKFVDQKRPEPDRSERTSVSISQLGPNDVPVVFSNTGVVHQIVQVEGDKKRFMEKEGRKIEIGHVDIETDKVPRFYDTEGHLVEDPVLRNVSGQIIEIKPPPDNTITSNGQTLLLDRSGGVIGAEPDQTDSSILLAQGDRLVYYMIHANDVYALFLTGQKNLELGLNNFPSSPKELEPVKTYAREHGFPLPDENASVVLLKSSWIELPAGWNYDDFLSVEADVPDFTKHDDRWERKGSRPAKLAMVGMHVAFSVKRHSELVWATFEHKYNTPNVSYAYDSKQRRSASKQPDCGIWLFSSGRAEPSTKKRPCYGVSIEPCADGQTVDANGACVTANYKRASMNKMDGNIYPENKMKIGASDILRISPWGSPVANAKLSTAIISINKSVQARLSRNDVRKNYFMIGATWLDAIEPRVPSRCQSFPLGSKCLANSTIETFQQPSNCLSCHHDPKNMPDGVSHLYKSIDPLFPPGP
jgi:hypothetical protein